MRDLDKQLVMLRYYAERIAPYNWSLGFLQLEPGNWAQLAKLIPSLPVDVVVDHQALLKSSSMLPANVPVAKQPGMEAILELLESGNFWIKISAPYRNSESDPHYDDLQGVIRLLVDANPRRVVYGSDWPHTPRMKIRSKEEALLETPFLVFDDSIWLQRLREWLSEEEWDLLMVKNPSVLYRF
ncbi:hypothetical protein MBLNU13_g09853t1 [Cladosporium sp. NU13]